MRSALRIGTLVALAVPGLGLASAGSTAFAATGHGGQPAVLQQAWYHETLLQQVSPPVDPGKPPADEPTGVPKGDLAVAHTSNDKSSSKVSEVAFDVTSLLPGTTVTEFTMTLTVDTSNNATNVGADAAPVLACLPTRLWSPADGGDYSDAPPVDCGLQAKPEIKGNTYTFDLTTLAQSWVDDQNLGVALVNNPDNTQTPFQVVFKGDKDIKATLRYTPPVSTPPVGQPTGSGGGAGSGSGGASSGGTGTTSGGTSTGGTTSVPPPLPPVSPGNLPPSQVTGGASDGGQPPQVAGGSGGTPSQPPAPQPVALKPASALPTTGFWIGGAALALLLVTAGLVLRDQREPVAVAARSSRLNRLLRDRRTTADRAPALVRPTRLTQP